MLHKKRIWCLTPVVTPDDLAQKLVQHTWTCCTAFELSGYLFLNDATCGDGAQEYAVLKRMPNGHFLQIESITFSWCDEEKALRYIHDIVGGKYDAAEWATSLSPKLQTATEHGSCGHCA